MTSRIKKDILVCVALLAALGSGMTFGYNFSKAESRVACEVTR